MVSEQDIPGDWIEFGAVDGDTTKLQFTFAPKDSSHVGSHTLRVRGTDSGGLSAEAEFEVVVTAVNDAPKAPTAGLGKHVVDEDVASDHATATYQVAAFTDEEDDAVGKDLTYVAQLVVGGTPGALPPWIDFNKATRTFTFTPTESSHVGSHTLRVTGRDSGGLSDSAEFVLKVAEVNDAPKAPAAGLANQEVDEDVKSDHKTATYQVPAFTDEETSALTYTFSVVRVVGDDKTPISTPKWITLVSATRTFTFTPTLSTHAGSYEVTVVGKDASDLEARATFELEVAEVNDAPKKPAAGLANQEVDEDVKSDHKTATHQVPAFTDEEDDAANKGLTYVVQLVVGGTPGALPAWIDFNKATRTFTFTPTESSHVGSHTLRVTGRDSGGLSDFAEFVLKVAEVNDAPKAPAAGLANQEVDEDVKSDHKTATHQVPAFTDEEDDAANKGLTYVAQLVVGGTPGALPPWIDFNKATRTFTFTPTESSHVGIHTLRVTGRDSGGLSDFAEFVLKVAEVNDAPKAPAAGLADQDDVMEDTDSIYVFNAFEDEEDDAAGVSLTYTFSVVRVEDDGSLTQVSASEIEWIDFVATTRTFTFKPDKSSHAGTYKVTVVGTDAGIGGDDATKESISAEFELEVREVNDAPEAPDAASLKIQQAIEGLDSSYPFPVFKDEEDTELKYEAQLVVGGTPGALPLWIEFDETTRTFTFKPRESSLAGDYRLLVTATDHGIGDDDATKERTAKSAGAYIMLKVIAVNDRPEGQTLANQSVMEDKPKTYEFPKFTDEETSALAYKTSWAVRDLAGDDIVDADGQKTFVPHATWIKFGDDPNDPTKKQFAFTPSDSSHAGRYTLRVTAKDGQGEETFQEFTLVVSPVNDVPVASSLVAHTVQEVDEDIDVLAADTRYVFDAFTDEETSTLTYTFSVVRVGAEGTPVDVSSWMLLGVDPDDASKQRFAFTPRKSLDAGQYKVTVVGMDAGGATASAVFALTVSEFNDAPKASTLTEQKVREDVDEAHASATYRVPAFTDEEDDAAGVSLKYSYTVERVVSGVKTPASPKWIDFDEATRTFTFAPEDSSDTGSYEVTVVGEDAGIGGDDSTSKSISAKFALTVDEFNDEPKASSLADRTVVEDTEVIYPFPVFTDEETPALTYTAFWAAEGTENAAGEKVFVPLPADGWIAFGAVDGDATKMQFAFKPDKSWHAGQHTLRVVGTDSGIGDDDATRERTEKSISADFLLDVEAVDDRPVAPAEFSEEVLKGEEVRKGVEEAGAMTYRVPAFTDEEDDRAGAPLAYSYTIVRVAPSGDEVPVSVSEIEQWVDFDASSSSPTFRTFTFTPTESRHKGEYRVRVFAQDTSGAKTSVQFMLTVGEFNDKPVASTLVGRTVVEDTPSTYVFDAFTDEETSALTYTAFWAAEGTESTAGEKVFVPLPADGWIAFGEDPDDPTKMQFAFKPHKSWHTGKHTLRVVGTDAGIGGDPDTKKSDFAEFVLEVVDFNDAPVASSLAAHTVQEDVDEAHASVTYPVGAFTDEETSTLTYSYTIVRVEKNGDETAVSVSDWVDFDDDASSPTFTFTPHGVGTLGRTR